ncbi:ATPase AAA [Spirochaetia bacterium]|nr:ATPase AAA [Spirochaetia bacterium]
MGGEITNLESSPRLLVFAGPNGSGKSTVAKGIKIIGTYINADDIKAQSRCSDIDAAREAERLREFCLESGADFTFETVLSTNRNLELLRRAKLAGYTIECIFVLTASVEINILRVKSRVSEGGHDVPIEKIRSRYEKSLVNLPELLSICETCTIFDNSFDTPVVIYRKDKKREVISEVPLWPKKRITNLVCGQNL